MKEIIDVQFVFNKKTQFLKQFKAEQVDESCGGARYANRVKRLMHLPGEVVVSGGTCSLPG